MKRFLSINGKFYLQKDIKLCLRLLQKRQYLLVFASSHNTFSAKNNYIHPLFQMFIVTGEGGV